VKGIQVCSNKGPGHLQRRDNHKNKKMGWGHLKIFFSKTLGPFLSRLGTNHPWVKGIQTCSKEGDSPSLMGDNSKIVKIQRKFLKILIDPPHPLVCCKRRLNGAVLRMRPEKPRSRVTAGTAQ
jgi:hypothetical protein